MCKPTTNIISKVEELMELRKLAEELQNQMDAITDEIKLFMGDEETMMAGCYKVTYQESNIYTTICKEGKKTLDRSICHCKHCDSS